MSADRIDALERRLGVPENRSAITELTARYALSVNRGWADQTVDLDALPDIVAPDATWESKAMGARAEGLPAIVSGVEGGTRATRFAMHSYTNPVIEIDGDAAHSRWLVFVPGRHGEGPPNMILMEDLIDYVRLPTVRRIRTIERWFGMELVDGTAKGGWKSSEHIEG